MMGTTRSVGRVVGRGAGLETTRLWGAGGDLGGRGGGMDDRWGWREEDKYDWPEGSRMDLGEARRDIVGQGGEWSEGTRVDQPT